MNLILTAPRLLKMKLPTNWKLKCPSNIVILLYCDSGSRKPDSQYSENWINSQVLQAYIQTGRIKGTKRYCSYNS